MSFFLCLHIQQFSGEKFISHGADELDLIDGVMRLNFYSLLWLVV